MTAPTAVRIESRASHMLFLAGSRMFEAVPSAGDRWVLWENVEDNWFSRPEWTAPREEIPSLIDRELAETADLEAERAVSRV